MGEAKLVLTTRLEKLGTKSVDAEEATPGAPRVRRRLLKAPFAVRYHSCYSTTERA